MFIPSFLAPVGEGSECLHGERARPWPLPLRYRGCQMVMGGSLSSRATRPSARARALLALTSCQRHIRRSSLHRPSFDHAVRCRRACDNGPVATSRPSVSLASIQGG